MLIKLKILIGNKKKTLFVNVSRISQQLRHITPMFQHPNVQAGYYKIHWWRICFLKKLGNTTNQPTHNRPTTDPQPTHNRPTTDPQPTHLMKMHSVGRNYVKSFYFFLLIMNIFSLFDDYECEKRYDILSKVVGRLWVGCGSVVGRLWVGCGSV